MAVGFGRMWGGYAADGFPASDGRRVLVPLDCGVQAGGAWFQLVSSAGRIPRVISIACSSPGPERNAISALRLVRLLAAQGVGSRRTATEDRVRSPFEPCWFGLPLVPSLARGVGSSGVGRGGETTCDDSGLMPVPTRRRGVPVSLAFEAGNNRTATDNGVPMPLPLIPRARWTTRRASHRCGSSPSLGLLLAGVGNSTVTASGRVT